MFRENRPLSRENPVPARIRGFTEEGAANQAWLSQAMATAPSTIR